MSDAIECPLCGGSGVEMVEVPGGIRAELCVHASDATLDDRAKVALLREALARMVHVAGKDAAQWCEFGNCATCEAERALEKTK